MKRECEKLKHLQKASDKIRHDQQALINLQAQKIANLQTRVNPSQRNSQSALCSAEKVGNVRGSQSPAKVSQELITPTGNARRISHRRASPSRAEGRLDPNWDIYSESRCNNEAGDDFLPSPGRQGSGVAGQPLPLRQSEF